MQCCQNSTFWNLAMLEINLSDLDINLRGLVCLSQSQSCKHRQELLEEAIEVEWIVAEVEGAETEVQQIFM